MLDPVPFEFVPISHGGTLSSRVLPWYLLPGWMWRFSFLCFVSGTHLKTIDRYVCSRSVYSTAQGEKVQNLLGGGSQRSSQQRTSKKVETARVEDHGRILGASVLVYRLGCQEKNKYSTRPYFQAKGIGQTDACIK